MLSHLLKSLQETDERLPKKHQGHRPEDRQNMFREADQCTITRDLNAMLVEFVPSLKHLAFEKEFDNKFPVNVLENICKRFRVMLKLVNTRESIRGDRMAVRDLSYTWVRITLPSFCVFVLITRAVLDRSHIWTFVPCTPPARLPTETRQGQCCKIKRRRRPHTHRRTRHR